MSVTFYGIRHHGPGCARSVVDALEAKPPLALLIEGPPDADAQIVSAALEGMTPPVALMVHREDDPKQAVFYPFAQFSPEWQALRWALARGVPVRFMDLPWRHRFALQKPPEDLVESEEAPATGEGADENPPPEESPADASLRRDPLKALAEADGYLDS